MTFQREKGYIYITLIYSLEVEVLPEQRKEEGKESGLDYAGNLWNITANLNFSQSKIHIQMDMGTTIPTLTMAV